MASPISGRHQMLADLVDKQQIREATLRYFRGIDRCDAELLGSVFHADAIAEYGATVLTGPQIGAQLAAGARDRHVATMHAAANQLVEVDGDVARSETYSVNYHVEHGAPEKMLIRGMRYVDRFERRDGAWRIAHRVVICDWDRIDTITEHSSRGGYAGTLRSRDDPSYRTPPGAGHSGTE